MFREVFYDMCSVIWCAVKCSVIYVPQNVFREMWSAKCTTKCVPQNVFHEMCSAIMCSVKCSVIYVPQSVPQYMFRKMCSAKYFPRNVFCKMCSANICSTKCFVIYVLRKCVVQYMFCMKCVSQNMFRDIFVP